MENLQLILQSAVAISVVYVWVFRYHNVLKEFEQFGLGDTTRNLVGASKIIASHASCCWSLAPITHIYPRPSLMALIYA